MDDADKATELIAERDKRRYLATLRRLVTRLEQRAQISRSGDGTADGERSALRLEAEAKAIKWALVIIDAELEGARQFSDALPGNR